jgi:hypothetical protein
MKITLGFQNGMVPGTFSHLNLMFRGDDFDADISVRILHEGENHPTTRETLENLGESEYTTTLALRRPPKLSKFCVCCNTLP